MIEDDTGQTLYFTAPSVPSAFSLAHYIVALGNDARKLTKLTQVLNPEEEEVLESLPWI